MKRIAQPIFCVNQEIEQIISRKEPQNILCRRFFELLIIVYEEFPYFFPVLFKLAEIIKNVFGSIGFGIAEKLINVFADVAGKIIEGGLNKHG